MSNVSKVSISLTAELNQLVQNAVASGRYASASEVVREALRGWRETQQQKAVILKELRRLWKEGVDSGPGQYSSMEEIKAAARLEFESRRKSA